jgi:hypothetical protein
MLALCGCLVAIAESNRFCPASEFMFEKKRGLLENYASLQQLFLTTRILI